LPFLSHHPKMPENTYYFEAITAACSMLASEEDGLNRNATLSLDDYRRFRTAEITPHQQKRPEPQGLFRLFESPWCGTSTAMTRAKRVTMGNLAAYHIAFEL
jgi:hypothetical protein